MDFSSIVLILIALYWLAYIICLCLIDCDIGLKWAEICGRPVECLQGKVVWVTGASSGIGEHLALALAKRNVKLVISARRKDQLERVKQRCLEFGKSLTSQDVLVLPLDVTNFDSHKPAFDHVIAHFGTLDVLVCNAGRSQREAWEDISVGVDRAVFDLNVFSVVSLTRLAVRYFTERGSGHVAVTSSIAGVVGAPFSGSYTGSKWALHGYFNGLRSEKLGSGLTVSLLCPGPTFTEFLAESFMAVEGEKLNGAVSPNDKRMTAERCGELFAVALSNRLPEVWAAVFPIIPMAYVVVYCPNIGRWISEWMGPNQFAKLRDSRDAPLTGPGRTV